MISGNVKAFADDLEKAFGLVQDNAELVQTYEEALDAGKSPQEAFGACMVQAAAEGLWGLTEKQLEEAFLKGFGDWDDSAIVKSQEGSDRTKTQKNAHENATKNLLSKSYTIDESAELARLQNALLQISSTQPVSHPSYGKTNFQNTGSVRNHKQLYVNHQAVPNELRRKQAFHYRR